MQVGTGKSILNGIAIGKLKIYKKKDTVISTAQVADTAAEEARFEEARAKAIDQQTALYEKALAEAGEDIAEVFNIHAMMLDDDDFVDAIKEIINGQHMCAEYAVKKAGDNQAAVFAAMDDPYLQARSADVIDIAQAMLDILQGVDNATLQGTEPSILVAEDLAPSETVRMDKSLLLGFITREGSSNSHTAILARSMNIPALIQCKEIQEDWDGKMAVVDGYNACVYVDPTPDLLESLKKRQQEDQKKQALLQELKGKPNTTLDGKTINVFANIGGMSDVGAVQQNDAGGVGLFRTEFVYLNCTDYPTEEYQFEAYKQVLESLAPKKVVVRTCDIGADKTVDYMKLDHEDNPALGYRAIRICLTRKDFFKTQLRALLRASAYGNMSIMFPMITSLRELQDAKAVLDGRPSYCINIVRDVSPNCDCHPENDVPIVPDVGMFASADPVALDLACAEAINRQPVLPNSAITDLKHEHDCDRFHAAHDNTHWQDLIEHGKKLGIGQDTYELVTIR
mgnify:CR=1 FL=1